MMPHIHELSKGKDKFWRDLQQTVMFITVVAFTLLSFAIWVIFA